MRLPSGGRGRKSSSLIGGVLKFGGRAGGWADDGRAASGRENKLTPLGQSNPARGSIALRGTSFLLRVSCKPRALWMNGHILGS